MTLATDSRAKMGRAKMGLYLV